MAIEATIGPIICDGVQQRKIKILNLPKSICQKLNAERSTLFMESLARIIPAQYLFCNIQKKVNLFDALAR